MQIKTISAHLDHTFSLRHNNRSIISNNVDAKRSNDNYYAVMSGHTIDGTYYATLEEIYEKVFEPSWKEYQNKQRPSRRYNGSYLEYIKEKERTPIKSDKIKNTRVHPAYEIVCQIGNITDTDWKKHNDDFKKSCRILEDTIDHIRELPYVITITEKELKDPFWKPPQNCIILLNAVTHEDESCPGNHITLIPYCTSNRGAEHQALLKHTFAELGFSSDFVDACRLDGSLIVKEDKHGNILYDSKGIAQTKKVSKNNGALDWIDKEITSFIEKEMKERYNWERKKGVNKQYHEEILDYKIHAKQNKLDSLEYKYNQKEAEFVNYQNQILYAVNNINQIYEDSLTMSKEELWAEYRKTSSEFWSWYKEESKSTSEKVERAKNNKNEIDYLNAKAQYYHNLFINSNNLLYYLAFIINRIFKHFKYKEHSNELKELLKQQRELGHIAKEFSTISYNARNELKSSALHSEYILKLRNLEKTLREDYSSLPEISRSYDILL